MPGSSLLGTSDSILGEVVLAAIYSSGIIVTEYSFSDTLTITDSFANSNNRIPLTEVLRLTESVVVGYSRIIEVTDTLIATDSVDRAVSYTRELTDTLAVQEPTISQRVDNVTITIPTLVVIANSKFIPFISLQSYSSIIYMANPIFGDIQSSINEVLITSTVGGAKYSYIKTSKRRKFKYEFNFRHKKRLELELFLETSNLDWLVLINWKNEQYYVKITNNPVVFMGLSNGWYSCVLEFEGYRQVVGEYLCLE